MEKYPYQEEFLSRDDDDEYQGFFTSDIIDSLASEFSYKEEIFNIGLQLGISHSISMHFKSRYDNLYSYASEIMTLWRETYNTGDFEACRKLETVLREVGFGSKASTLVSGFLKWVNAHICCRDKVESNAKSCIRKLSKFRNNTGLRPLVVKEFDKWCKQQIIENNHFNMALYLQLYGPQLYKNEEEYQVFYVKILTYLNTSLKHHIPHDAFYLTVITNMDIKNNVAISSTYLAKEITEFLHCRRLGKICDDIPDMETMCQLAHSLGVEDKIIRRIEHRNRDSVFLFSYDLLYAWKQNCPDLDEKNQVDSLTQALEEIDMNYLAYSIKKEFAVWQMFPYSEIQIDEIKNKKRPFQVIYEIEGENPVNKLRKEEPH